MAALTTLALVGSAVAGAAGTAYSVSEKQKAARKQERMLKRQEQEAKTIAAEAGALNATKEDTGADIALGRKDTSTTSGAGAGATSTRTGGVKARVGGLPKISASARIGM